MKAFFADLWKSKAVKSFVFTTAGALATLVTAMTVDISGSTGGVIAALGAFVAAAISRWVDSQPKESAK